MGVLIVVLFVVIASGIFYLSWYTRTKRIEALSATAKRMGLTFSAEDPFSLEELPFTLMSRGDGRGAENVMSGTVDGLDVRVFDYWYYTTSTDSKGGSSRTYYRYTCAASPVPARCPHLTIVQESFLTRVANHLGVHDIEFESDEFNRKFNVSCDDRKFAYAFIDQRMMEWLMICTDIAFEASGRYLIAYTGKLPPDRWAMLTNVVRAFHDHVPAVVRSLYPVAHGGNTL